MSDIKRFEETMSNPDGTRQERVRVKTQGHEHVPKSVLAVEEEFTPYAARLALQAVWVVLSAARRGEAPDELLRTAEGIVELLGSWCERTERAEDGRS